MEWTNCYSGRRYGVEKGPSEIRSEYERDYDRIIFSSAFRRLQNKTQVFPLPQHVFVHNRLTHSLEVASVGRSLGKLVGKEISGLPNVSSNDKSRRFYKNHLGNVIAAACLAHDLGNPAFGHSGEEAISKFFIDKQNDEKFRLHFTKEEWADLIRFEGNANSLRVVTKKRNTEIEGGYRLTYSTLASIIKYPCAAIESMGKGGPLHLSKYGFFQADKIVYESIVTELNMVNDKGNAFFRHPFSFLVEAADDICYNIIDFEDAHRLKIIDLKKITDLFYNLVKCNKDENISHLDEMLKKLDENANEKIAYLRSKAINYLTNSAANIFVANETKILAGTFNASMIDSIEEAKSILQEIEDLSVDKIYNHNSVVRIEMAGFKVMSSLISDFVEAALIPKAERLTRHKKILRLLPEQDKFNEGDSPYIKIMHILDFMSGMTDLYALELYKNTQGISLPTI